MSTTVLEDEIMATVAKLAPAQQQQVLAFVQYLTAAPVGIPGHQLLVFADSIAPTDLIQMQAAIDADCERVSIHDW